MVARILRSPRARAITLVPCNNTCAVQYRVILHGAGIGKYYCRNIYWIIKVEHEYESTDTVPHTVHVHCSLCVRGNMSPLVHIYSKDNSGGASPTL